MSEKVWYKAAKAIVRASGNPLFQANDTLVEILKTLLNDEQVNFLLNFRKPILTFQELKKKTGLNDNDLMDMLNSIMDNGIIMDIPIEGTSTMEYHLLPPVADIFEFSLVGERPIEQKKKLAQLYEKMFKETTELVQSNYEGMVPILKEQVPIFTRIIPIEKELTVPQEKVMPLHEASKIIDKQDIISLSECPCKLERSLLGNSCEVSSDRFRCFHFGNIGRFFIEHNLGKSVSKEEAKRILLDAEEEGLVHKTFHDECNVELKENTLCNCCKCCCILFQTYYRGIISFRTITSYMAKVNESKCIGCGICVEKCPIEAISLSDGKTYDDKNRCIGCGLCVHHCPEQARTLKQIEQREVYLPPLVMKV